MAATQRKHRRPALGAKVTGQARGQHDGRERRIEGEDRDEGRGRDAPHPAVLQRPGADAVRGMQHQRRHGRLDAVEHPLHQR
ncbi:MAG TPA: hypothetical protein VIR81_07690 [Myxococcales bacterium]